MSGEGPIARLRVAALRLRKAALAECIEPDGPLGAWVEAQDHALTAQADVAEHQERLVTDVLGGADKAIGTRLGECKALAEATRTMLASVERTQVVLDIKTQQVMGEMIERLTPQLVEGVRDAVIIREKRYNRKVETSRIAGVVAVALGLLVGGYVWGASGNPSGGQDQLDREVASRTKLAIQHCRDTARWLGDDHQPLCSLTDFLPPVLPGTAGGGASAPPASSSTSSSDSPGLLMVHPGEPVRFH